MQDEKGNGRRLTLDDINPAKLYSAKVAAEVLELNVDTVYRLGRTKMLPRTGLGPKRGKTRFLGSVILHYAHHHVNQVA
ncbi:MAG: hypothetical protein ACRENP_10725 [Longimicrobiales bacterium]